MIPIITHLPIRCCGEAAGHPPWLAWIFHGYYGVLFVGGLLGWWLEKKHPQLSQEFTFPVASGWIARESLKRVALVLWENGPEMVATALRAVSVRLYQYDTE